MAEWTRVCAIDEIPVLGARVIRTGQEAISVFRNEADEVFALHDAQFRDVVLCHAAPEKILQEVRRVEAGIGAPSRKPSRG